jgi:TonB family protein
MLYMRTSSLKDPIHARVLVFLGAILLVAGLAQADEVSDKRKAAAQKLATDIARSAVHRVYAPDLTDASGRETILWRFFAATFSELLSDNANNFAVVKRVDAHRYLARSGQTDRDLSTAEVLAKFAYDLGTDGILWGKVSLNQDLLTIDFILRDPQGRELLRRQCEEKVDPSLRDGLKASQSDFYFAGLDGVTIPKCLYCPIPEFPTGQGSPRVEGKVILEVLITAVGKADEIRVVQKLDPNTDRSAMKTVETWRFATAKDPDGKLVPVRMPVEVTFKLRWRPYP